MNKTLITDLRLQKIAPVCKSGIDWFSVFLFINVFGKEIYGNFLANYYVIYTASFFYAGFNLLCIRNSINKNESSYSSLIKISSINLLIAFFAAISISIWIFQGKYLASAIILMASLLSIFESQVSLDLENKLEGRNFFLISSVSRLTQLLLILLIKPFINIQNYSSSFLLTLICLIYLFREVLQFILFKNKYFELFISSLGTIKRIRLDDIKKFLKNTFKSGFYIAFVTSFDPVTRLFIFNFGGSSAVSLFELVIRQPRIGQNLVMQFMRWLIFIPKERLKNGSEKSKFKIVQLFTIFINSLFTILFLSNKLIFFQTNQLGLIIISISTLNLVSQVPWYIIKIRNSELNSLIIVNGIQYFVMIIFTINASSFSYAETLKLVYIITIPGMIAALLNSFTAKNLSNANNLI